jgi:ferredoxin--NADP+ reductase
LFVATVTGVVPYISILRDYLHYNQTGHQFYLLFGASYQSEFTYKDEIVKISQSHSDLIKFVPTVSRPQEAANSSWKGEIGRVNKIVGKYIEQYNLDVENTLIYACGHPGMIEDVKEKWVPNGFKVEEERFWKED